MSQNRGPRLDSPCRPFCWLGLPASFCRKSGKTLCFWTSSLRKRKEHRAFCGKYWGAKGKCKDTYIHTYRHTDRQTDRPTYIHYIHTYITLHCIALHYITYIHTLHCITLHYKHTYICTYIHTYRQTGLHTLHTYKHDITLHYITLPYLTLHTYITYITYYIHYIHT